MFVVDRLGEKVEDTPHLVQQKDKVCSRKDEK